MKVRKLGLLGDIDGGGSGCIDSIAGASMGDDGEGEEGRELVTWVGVGELGGGGGCEDGGIGIGDGDGGMLFASAGNDGDRGI